MNFTKKNKTNEEFYSVNYDKEKLNKIMEELKNYGYTAVEHCSIEGHTFTKWPATEKNIKKRLATHFNATNKDESATLLPESIVHHTEDDRNYITYDYLYTKLPDLYAYIDILLNNNHRKYRKIFKGISEYIFHDVLYFYENADQFVLEGIFDYANSKELTKHDSINDDKEYDYKGLNELYKETLECFQFNLIAVKEYLEKPEPVNVLRLQLKK